MILATTILSILTLIAINAVPISASSFKKSEFNYTLDEGYPIGSKLFGNIAGVDVDRNNNVIIFHRGSHIWDASTFDGNEVYQPDRNTPIPEETVVTIDPRKKEILQAWGKDLFYMPHGLSLDFTGKNLWLTDVALHQVFKYPLNGSQELMSLGSPFVPGNDDTHFCKPTSVADTGEFIFVADGYCNSRVVMFSATGNFLGEFGQSSEASFISSSTATQPTFNVPHKITYAKEARMLCVADRENGRIQCFSFEPKHDKMNSANERLILNGAIEAKFIIADPQFNGRLFSLDYSPYRGGIIVAVSGQSPFHASKPPLGFVYNVTTGQLLSKFSPPKGRTFGMAHDLAITGDEAGSLFVVDIAPVNLWKFSRPIAAHKSSRAVEIGRFASNGVNQAITMMSSKDHGKGIIWYIFLGGLLVTILLVVNKTRRIHRYTSPNSFAALYSNSYPASINSLFGNSSGFQRRGPSSSTNSFFGTMFSRRSFFNLFERSSQQQNDFSRIPLEESDNSDDDKSDSDVEEFNINQANASVKINV